MAGVQIDLPSLWPPPDEMRDDAAHRWLVEHDVWPDGTAPVGIDADSLLLGALLVDGRLTEATESANLSTAEMQRRITQHKRDELFDAVGMAFNPAEVLARFAYDWTDEQRHLFLIELYTASPFAPYEPPKSTKRKVRAARQSVAQTVNAAHLVNDVVKVLADATSAHTTSTTARVGVLGLGSAVAVGAAGFLAAPAIGAALGASAGLSGAAASAHGLSLLGGGTLAAGGMGMTGGVWMVTGAAATTGATLGVTASAAHALGAAEYRHELIKLQATHRLVLAVQSRHLAMASEVSTRLVTDAESLRAQLTVERELNAKNAARLKDLAAKVTAVEAAIAFTAAS